MDPGHTYRSGLRSLHHGKKRFSSSSPARADVDSADFHPSITGVLGNGEDRKSKPTTRSDNQEKIAIGGFLYLQDCDQSKMMEFRVLGAASMATYLGKHPGQLKDDVASPGGTTIAGIHELEKGGFRGILMNAVIAAAKRSRELSQS
ncbi:hypothetical protein RJ639_024079 [Escallonia herrerae]|uniref:Pyrroline-5-carboxylate reductase dimerisation domain-containing protein n=1 Tax=Escallonia herrerae TaxID=1293975 RepID=A0AA89AFJ2_9ASTE|nr:hypothetical protein RJ639_024079 [Escallonia herrerae]